MLRHVLGGWLVMMLAGCGDSPDIRPGGSERTGGAPLVEECPANTGPDVYADPISGSPAGAAPYPTGVAEPPECRFSTLTAALSAAGSSKRVVATGASPGAPAVFSQESFPLLITGTTVTTTDATLDPTQYVLRFDGTPPAALLLYSGARVEGFTVLHAAHQSGTGYSVACGRGRIGLGSVVLDGNGLGVPTGVAIAGTDTDCSAELTQLTVRGGFYTAVNISTYSSALNSMTGGLLEGNRAGFVLQRGLGSLSGVTVRDNNGTGVSVVPASGATPELSITDTVIRGNQSGLLLDDGSGVSSVVTVSGGEISQHGTSMFLLPGIDVRLGSLSLTGTQVTHNTGGGLVMRGGSAQVGAGVTLSDNGSNYSRGGIELEGGTLTVGAATIQGNQGGGIVVSGGSLTTGDGLLVKDNKQYGLQMKGGTALTESSTFSGTTGLFGQVSSGIRVEGGTLTVGAGTTVSGNPYGVHVVASATLSGAPDNPIRVSNNLEGGILVDLPSGTLTVRHAVISGNGSPTTSSDPYEDAGIEVLRSPPSEGAHALRVEDSVLTENVGYGLFLRGSEGEVSATLERCEVSRNQSTGLYITKASTTVALRYNEIFRNNTANLSYVGGAHFAAGTLESFVGNALGGNTGHQLSFSGAQDGLSPGWDISAGSCDGTANVLYCYKAAGSYGLYALAGIVVDARRVYWESDTPTSGTDYDPLAGSLFSVSPSCGATPRVCPQ